MACHIKLCGKGHTLDMPCAVLLVCDSSGEQKPKYESQQTRLFVIYEDT